MDPEFVAVHAESAEATPQRLRQWWVPCALHGKLDLLWFFVKTHLKQRTIVFLATCKQVCAHRVFAGYGPDGPRARLLQALPSVWHAAR
jgi:superfamily II DNA/RNA helicase